MKSTQKKDHMTNEMAEKVINFLIEGAESNASRNNGNKSITVLFFGGEPALNIPTMKHMIGYAVEKCKESKIMPSFSLDTNCTIWNEEYEDFLNYWIQTIGRVNIQLSIDGCPEVVNRDRPLRTKRNKGDKTSAELITSVAKEHLRWIKDHPNNSLTARASVTKFSLPYAKQSYDYLRDEIGIENIWFMPVHEDKWDESDLKLFKEQYQLIADRIYNECTERKDPKLLFSFSNFQCRLQGPDSHCGAGNHYCCIDTDGTIYFCHRTKKPTEEKSIILGHVDKGLDVEAIEKYKDNNIKKCHGINNCAECTNKNCKFCFAANYELNGDLYKGFPNYCKLSLAEDHIRWKLRRKLEAAGILPPLGVNNNHNHGNMNMNNQCGNMNQPQNNVSLTGNLNSLRYEFHNFQSQTNQRLQQLSESMNRIMPMLTEIKTILK
jgi:uncharacterized protein